MAHPRGFLGAPTLADAWGFAHRGNTRKSELTLSMHTHVSRKFNAYIMRCVNLISALRSTCRELTYLGSGTMLCQHSTGRYTRNEELVFVWMAGEGKDVHSSVLRLICVHIYNHLSMLVTKIQKCLTGHVRLLSASACMFRTGCDQDTDRMGEYLEYNHFLPDINNEYSKKNPQYAANIASLDKLAVGSNGMLPQQQVEPSATPQTGLIYFATACKEK
eukprot:354618-Pelagomonas_calceolata.AAC.1